MLVLALRDMFRLATCTGTTCWKVGISMASKVTFSASWLSMATWLLFGWDFIPPMALGVVLKGFGRNRSWEGVCHWR